MRTCGSCKHWERAKPYGWGSCIAPLPVWAAEMEANSSTAVVCRDDPMASECVCYEEATPKESA